MKKLILLLLCAVSSFSLATTQASGGSNLRDSIFRIYRSMPADTARTLYIILIKTGRLNCLIRH